MSLILNSNIHSNFSFDFSSKLMMKIWDLFFILADLTVQSAQSALTALTAVTPLILLISLIAPATAFASSLTPASLNSNFNNVRFDQHLGESLPLDATVTDERGQTRTLGSFFNRRPVILVFSYFKCPNLCTLVLNGLVEGVKPLAGKLGKDFDILTLSIDPDEKSSLALAKRRTYMARLGKSENNQDEGTSIAWHFLTADLENIKRITGASGFYYKRDEKSGDFAHASGLLIATPTGIISQYFFGIQFESSKLQSALTTAGREGRGSIIDRILLFCFHYDPAASVHGAVIIKAIRLVGALSATLLFVFLFRLSKSSPRRSIV
jgi:protein SCO1/2